VLTVRASIDGNWKPNDLPDMELSSVRKLTFNVSGALGSATLSSLAITSPNLTFGSVTTATPSATVNVTAGNTGTHTIITTATLSNGEIIKGALRLRVVDSTHETNGRDY
jgi:hypothetical protein